VQHYHQEGGIDIIHGERAVHQGLGRKVHGTGDRRGHGSGIHQTQIGIVHTMPFERIHITAPEHPQEIEENSVFYGAGLFTQTRESRESRVPVSASCLEHWGRETRNAKSETRSA